MERQRLYSPVQNTKSVTYLPRKNQLELQAAILLQQRQNLYSNTVPNNFYAHTEFEQNNNPNSIGNQAKKQLSNKKQPQTRSSKKIDKITQKIEQVIQLCNQNPSLKQIVQAEQQILRNLHTSRKKQKSPQKNSMKNQQMSKSKLKTHKKQNSVRQQINQKGLFLSDDIMEMIQEVQRKAVIQIEKLRSDKILLMKKLNQQMKHHNDEKRRSFQMKGKVNNLTQQLRKRQYASPQNAHLQNIQSSSQQNQLANFNNNNIKKQKKELQKKQNRNQNQPKIKRKSQLQQVHKRTNSRQNLKQSDAKSQDLGRLVQSMQYQIPPQPSFPKITQVNSQLQIQKQINRLQNENIKYRNVINQQSSSNLSPFKLNLRNQLKYLQDKTKHYQQILTSRNQKNDNQLQELLNQGVNLTTQGRRLMKAKSNPNLRTLQLEQVNQEIYEDERAERPTRQLFSSPNRYKSSTYFQPSNNQYISSGQYQKLLQSMDRAINT